MESKTNTASSHDGRKTAGPKAQEWKFSWLNTTAHTSCSLIEEEKTTIAHHKIKYEINKILMTTIKHKTNIVASENAHGTWMSGLTALQDTVVPEHMVYVELHGSVVHTSAVIPACAH